MKQKERSIESGRKIRAKTEKKQHPKLAVLEIILSLCAAFLAFCSLLLTIALIVETNTRIAAAKDIADLMVSLSVIVLSMSRLAMGKSQSSKPTISSNVQT